MTGKRFTQIQRLLWAVFLGCWVCWGSSGAALATGVSDLPASPPANNHWVIDYAEVLNRPTVGRLDKTLTELARQTGYQVHLVTVNRLDYEETALSLAHKVFQRWFPTQAAQTDQAVIVLATRVAQAALEAGVDLQTVLAPDVAKSIVEDNLLIPVRADAYNQGALDAVNRLAAVLSGRPDPGPPQVADLSLEGTFASRAETEEQRGISTTLVIVLLVIATVVPMATYYWYVLR